MPPELSPRFLARRILQIAVVALVVVLAVATLPGLGEVRERFAGARAVWLLAALALEAGSVVAFVAVFRGVFCPRLPWKVSFEVATAEQAANVLLPAGGAGGLALGAWALQRGGMDTRHIARRSVALFLITSSVNFATIVLAGSALALGVLGSAPPALAIVPAGLAAVAVAGVIALPRVLPHAGRRPRRRAWGTTAATAALANGTHDAGTLLRAHHWLVIGGALGYMAFDLATLAAGFLAFGSMPTPAVLLLAYGVGQLGGVIPVPGGIGGTDGALIAAFVLYGTSAPEATAAVLAYRAFQLGLPAIAGTVGFVRLQRTLAASRDPAALCAPMAAAAGH